MNTSRLSRHTFVLDKSVGADLSYISGRMGVSQSSLVRELLSPALVELGRLLRAVPDEPGPSDVSAFRKGARTAMADAYMDGLVALEVDNDA